MQRSLLAVATAAAVFESSALAEDSLSLDWNLPTTLFDNPLYGAPPNDFDCRSDAHPNPVIMLHGLAANRDVDLNQLAANLTGDGWCVFGKTYGAHTIPSWIGGLTEMRESAKEVADFIREVKEKTGADKVDVVGHSEGGVMALYVPLTQDGIAEMIDHNVALGPAIYGAHYEGFYDLLALGGDLVLGTVEAAIATFGAPAIVDMAPNGNVYNDFQAADKIVQPGNKATIITSTHDTLVPPETSTVDEEGVRNIVVQDTCPDDTVGHAGLAWDYSVWGLIVNALTEDYDRPFKCDMGLGV